MKYILLVSVVMSTLFIGYGQGDFVNDKDDLHLPPAFMPCALLLEDVSLLMAVFQFVQDRETFMETLKQRYGDVPEEASACWDTLEPYVNTALQESGDAAQGVWNYLKENDTTGDVAQRLEDVTGVVWDFTKENITPVVRDTWQNNISPFLRNQGTRLRNWWQNR